MAGVETGVRCFTAASLRAAGCDVQVMLRTVEQFVGAITRFCRAASEVSERSGQA